MMLLEDLNLRMALTGESACMCAMWVRDYMHLHEHQTIHNFRCNLILNNPAWNLVLYALCLRVPTMMAVVAIVNTFGLTVNDSVSTTWKKSFVSAEARNRRGGKDVQVSISQRTGFLSATATAATTLVPAAAAAALVAGAADTSDCVRVD